MRPTEPQALRAHRLAHRVVLGRSVDGTWSEDSFLVGGTTRATAAELGRQFGQRAIFELDHDDLLVVPLRCQKSSCGVKPADPMQPSPD